MMMMMMMMMMVMMMTKSIAMIEKGSEKKNKKLNESTTHYRCVHLSCVHLIAALQFFIYFLLFSVSKID